MFRIKLKILRENKGLSQAQLAKELNLAQSTIGMWESGNREPNFDTAKTLAAYFSVSTDYLLGVTDDSGTRKEPPNENLIDIGLFSDDDKKELLAIFEMKKAKYEKAALTKQTPRLNKTIALVAKGEGRTITKLTDEELESLRTLIKKDKSKNN